MVTTLNDPLNLRDYITFVVEYIKRYTTEAQPRTLVGFLTTLFKGTDFSSCLSDVTTPEKSVEIVVVTLQKLFSGNVHYTKFSKIANDILSGTHDDTLLENYAVIDDALGKTDRSEFFYYQLLQMVSCRFFSETDQKNLQFLSRQHEYTCIHLVILKHGLSTLFNVPCFFADRLYEEALTYDFDSAMRYALMKSAAENGSKRAALEYGNYIAKAGPYQEAFNYLLMALPLPAAIWNATYLIEQHKIGEDQEAQLRSAIKVSEKIDGSREFDAVRNEIDSVIYTGKNPGEASSRLFCYSVYFFLAYRGFYKAFNSMAKMLVDGTISIYDAEWELTTTALCEKYWSLAISGGNITAISNVGNKQFRRMVSENAFDSRSPTTMYTEELLVVAASMDFMRANYNLGNYYEFVAQFTDSPPKTRGEIEEIYERASKLDSNNDGVHGNLYFRLALITIDRKKKYTAFEKALLLQKTDAAYYLALMCFEDFKTNTEAFLLLKAKEYLSEHIDFFSKDIKIQAQFLEREINKYLER